MKTVLEIIHKSTQFLLERGIKNPRKEAVDLIGLCLKVRPLDLYMQFDRPLDEAELQRCREALKRRGKGEPYQYICGEVEFFNASFILSKDVLIPRQETEILVAMVAKELSLADAEGAIEGKTLWDLCCGSGCIGIALKKAFPALNVVLSDISPAALKVAEKNAARNEVAVALVEGDFLTPLMGQQVDYLVCNPPYVSAKEFEQLEPEVRNFEPKMALVADEEGLSFYKQLARELPRVLGPGGKMWLELGSTQGKAISEIFAPPIDSSMDSAKRKLSQDWSGLDRFFFLEME